MSTASRVIKNTSYLYLKMGITTFVTLYSTRLVLASLGASDFGVFHIVGGVISMLGFLNLAAANATYRFLACAEEENDLEKKKTVFNASLVLHVFIAMVTALLLLVAMYPLFNGILNIDYIKNTKEYKAMYKSLEDDKKIINVTNGKEKTFILVEKNENKKGYITNIGVNTIAKRLI